VDYRFDYTYTYDEQKRPLTKTGTATILTGPDAGHTVPLSTAFTYYPASGLHRRSVLGPP
jgi:hypothetical protein